MPKKPEPPPLAREYWPSPERIVSLTVHGAEFICGIDGEGPEVGGDGRRYDGWQAVYCVKLDGVWFGADDVFTRWMLDKLQAELDKPEEPDYIEPDRAEWLEAA